MSVLSCVPGTWNRSQHTVGQLYQYFLKEAPGPLVHLRGRSPPTIALLSVCGSEAL